MIDSSVTGPLIKKECASSPPITITCSDSRISVFAFPVAADVVIDPSVRSSLARKVLKIFSSHCGYFD